MKSNVVYGKDAPLQSAGENAWRKVLAHLPEQMVVEVRFDTGAVGAIHQHPHTQTTYVKSGEFVFTIDNQEFPVGEGDTLCFASGEWHGCVCKKQGVLIDVFTPMREDFLK